jgi:hypothetical protein
MKSYANLQENHPFDHRDVTCHHRVDLFSVNFYSLVHSRDCYSFSLLYAKQTIKIKISLCCLDNPHL